MATYMMTRGWDDPDRGTDAAGLSSSREWEEDLDALAPWSVSSLGPEHCLVSESSGAGEQAPDLFLFGKVSSTLDVGWDMMWGDDAWTGLEPLDGILAFSQSSGRGQLRRAWSSPAGNMYAGMRWPCDPLTGEGGKEAPGMTALAVSLAVARALESFGAEVEIKWPNDLLVNGKKVGGVLVEERRGRLMAGIGINLVHSPDPEQLRNDRAVEATDLCREGIMIRPIPLLRAIQVEAASVALFHGTQLSPQIEARLYLRNRHITIMENGPNSSFDKRAYRVVGLNVDGALRLSAGAEVRSITSGSIIPLDERGRR